MVYGSSQFDGHSMMNLKIDNINRYWLCVLQINMICHSQTTGARYCLDFVISVVMGGVFVNIVAG